MTILSLQITAEQFMAARPQVEETWATSVRATSINRISRHSIILFFPSQMVVNVNRAEAESILNKEGE